MEQRLLEFARQLRTVGIKVSFSEISDCLRGLALLGLEKPVFYHVLKATLVKDIRDFPLFDLMFYLYFIGMGAGLGQQDEVLPHRLDLQTIPSGGDIGIPGQGGSSGQRSGQGLAETLKLGDYERLKAWANQGVKQLAPIKPEYFDDPQTVVRQVQVAISWFEAVNMIDLDYSKGSLTNEEYMIAQERIKWLKGEIERQVWQLIYEANPEQALKRIRQINNLKEINFLGVKPELAREMKKSIDKLAKKIAVRKSRRYHKSKRGRVCLRLTLRSASKMGGIPLKLAYEDRSLKRPELVLLCDVSGSVAVFSEFMLQLVYAVQRRFKSVRSFFLIDLVDEVTDYLGKKDFDEGLQLALKHGRYSSTGFSNFGQVFEQFNQLYYEAVNHRTTVIVLGDAKNNWQNPNKEAFRAITARARRVYWLNPQPYSSWYEDDSVINEYLPFCHQVFECRNLKQLEQVVKEIL